jgi:putative redox protein
LDAKVNWKGGLSFNGTADSGFTLPLGASPVVGGADDGFRPMELMAISLAGCTGMDVISILQKKREQVTGFDVQVHAERAEKHPKVFTSVAVDFHVSGHNISEDALLRSIELSAEIYCPAQGMLKQVVPIEIKYYIYEERGDGERSLVKSGTYEPANT